MSLKVQYLLNGSSDLYETYVHKIVFDHQPNFHKDPCKDARTRRKRAHFRCLYQFWPRGQDMAIFFILNPKVKETLDFTLLLRMKIYPYHILRAKIEKTEGIKFS